MQYIIDAIPLFSNVDLSMNKKMPSSSSKLLLLAFSFCFFTLNLVSATLVSHDGRAITIDGKRRVLFSGSIHYPRSTVEVSVSFFFL